MSQDTSCSLPKILQDLSAGIDRHTTSLENLNWCLQVLGCQDSQYIGCTDKEHNLWPAQNQRTAALAKVSISANKISTLSSNLTPKSEHSTKKIRRHMREGNKNYRACCPCIPQHLSGRNSVVNSTKNLLAGLSLTRGMSSTTGGMKQCCGRDDVTTRRRPTVGEADDLYLSY